MRPTFVHLIVGLGLGTALAVSLALPGRLVIAGNQPVHGLTLPRSGARVVVEAAPPVRPAIRADLEPRLAPAVRSNQAPRANAVSASYAPRPRQHPQRGSEVAHRPVPAPAPKESVETLAVAPSPKTDSEDEKTKKAKKVKKAKKAKKVKKVEKPEAKPDRVRSKPEKEDKGERKNGKNDDRNRGGGRDDEGGDGHGKDRDD